MARTSRFRTGVERFIHDEGGQSLVFAALTFFVLTIVGLVVYGVGSAASTQLELQNAADTAAYAGGQVLVDSVAQVAWTNEAMAQVYYNGLRYATDTAVLGALAAFKRHEPYYGSYQGWANLDEEGRDENDYRALFAPTDTQLGIDDIEARYDNAWDQADEWIPRAEAWLKRLSRLQRGIAVLAPESVKCQIGYTALQNGAERFAYYPGFVLAPEDPSKRECSIERINTPTQYGWHVFSVPDGYSFEALHDPPDSQPPVLLDRYNASGAPGTDGVMDTVLDTWHMDLVQTGHDPIHMDVYAYYPCDPTGGNRREAPAQYRIETQIGTEAHLDLVRVISRNEIYHYQDGEETHLVVEESADATEWTIDGARIRQLQDGSLQTWEDDDRDGVADPDEWVDLPETTTIDGVEVPIDYRSGTGVQIVYPIRIRMRSVTLTLVEPVRIDFHTPAGWVYVRDEAASINGISTNHPTDRWERLDWGNHGQTYDSREDRTYHRLRTIAADQEWLYEWMRLGAYMEDMDLQKFALHAIMDHDPYYDANVVSADRMVFPKDGDDALWNAFPRWARPARIDDAIAEADASIADAIGYYDVDYGGWFDIAAGEPVRYQGRNAAYSQTRACWFCSAGGNCEAVSSRVTADATLVDYDPGSPTYGQTCIRPAGFWHEEWAQEGERIARIDALNALAGREVAIDISANRSGHIQVLCPCCERKYRFGHNPGDGADWMMGPPFQTEDIDFHRQQSYVRKYLCHGLGQHSASTPANPFARQVVPEDRVSIQAAQTYDPDVWQPPLALTAEFFRKGITVGAWRSTAGGALFDTIGGRSPDRAQQRGGIVNPFPTQEERNPLMRSPSAWQTADREDRARWMWGHFGVATVRPIFWNDTEYATPTQASTFGWAGTRPTWITDTHENIDPLLRQVNWYREEWLRGPMNLFDPDWDARLVSARKALDLREVYTGEDYISGRVAETALSFLLDELSKEPWPDNIVDLHRNRRTYSTRNPEWAVMQNFRRMGAPPMQGSRAGAAVDYDDPDIEPIIRH